MLTYATILIASLILAVVALFLYKVISDSSRSVYSSKDRIAIIDRHPDEKKGKALLKLMDILEDHDDIQKAYSNFEISDEVMAAIIENS